MLPPNGYPAIVAFYGDPHFNGAADACVDPKWESDNMELIRDFPGVPKLYCHRLIVTPLRNALIVATATGWAPKTAGCFAPRCKRGSTQVSIHTFGAAVDFDADDNPLILDCGLDDPRRTDPNACTIPQAVIDAFKAEGFMYGGDFKYRFDPMHFQWATGY